MSLEKIRALLRPSSIAVVGASSVPGKIGYVLVKNLIDGGFEGKICPVTLRAGEILGLRAYYSILDIEGDVDLAVVAVPAGHVPQVLEECGMKGVKAVAVISSGFSEVGNVELERQISSIAKKYGFRLLGPNIFGVYYGPAKMNAAFGPSKVLSGSVGFITQSGALGIGMMGWAYIEKVGLSAVVSLGNKADIDDADLLDFFSEDPNTKAVLIYMESAKDGKRFMKSAAKCSARKPVVVLKAGRTSKGAAAVASHTGSLAGADRIYDAAFKQSGVLRALDIAQAFDWVKLFVWQPPPRGQNVIIVTNGGGLGVMATDASEEAQLHLADLSKETVEQVRKHVPPFASVKNPLDMSGQANEETYRNVLNALLADKSIDVLLVLYCQTAVADPVKVAEVVVDTTRNCDKTILCNMVGGEEVSKAMELLEENRVPAYPTPERAVSALKAYYSWVNYSRKARSSLS